MKIKIDRSSPTAEEVSTILGRRVREMVEYPDGVVELELEGIDTLTDTQKQQLAERFNVYLSHVTIAVED